MRFNSGFVSLKAIADCIRLQYTALDKCELHCVQARCRIRQLIHNLSEYLFYVPSHYRVVLLKASIKRPTSMALSGEAC
jgi:hypothetical protein